MKKVLFIATRNPFSGRYSGDVIRSLKIINLLKKKYHLDVVFLNKNREFKTFNKNILTFKNQFFYKNFLLYYFFFKI